MTEDNNLEDIFSRYGGIIQPNDYKEKFSNIMNICMNVEERLNGRKNFDSSAPNIKVCLINNSEMNATIKKYGDTYYIGVFAGTFLVLDNLFMRMLAHPGLFQEFGNVGVEKEPEKVYEIRTSDYVHVYDLMEGMIYPQDVDRVLVANELKTLVVNFIMYHEYGHIMNGHYDYVHALHAYAFSESPVPGVEPPALDSVFSQVCELDADMYANDQMLLKLGALVMDVADLRKIYRDLKTAVYLYSFALYSYRKLMDGPQSKEFDINVATHPPASVRQSNLVLETYDHFSREEAVKISEEERKVICEYAIKAAVDAEHAFETITEQKFGGEYKFFEKEISAYMNNMNTQHPGVRKALEPFVLR